MGITNINRLAALIRDEHDSLLDSWRRKVKELPSAQALDVPTLNDHIPDLIIEIADALAEKSDETIAEALVEASPPAHGLQRLKDGFDIEEVVAEYNILRGCLHDLADSHGLNLQGQPFHIINRVLDGAIGLAVQAYASARAVEVQRRREEYLSFVVHDLRTPLHAISMAARVLELTMPPAGPAAEAPHMMKSLRRNVVRLEGLISKVIDENANLQTEIGVKLERRGFDLWPLVEELIHDLHPVAGTDSTRLINAVPDDLVVHADASLVRRIFQNLIANAIHYTPRGEVEIGATPNGTAFVECWVRDNGAGIPRDLLEKIFEKGEGDPGNPEGHGLGLSIVKTFVEAHGGVLSVETREGAGSTFRFSLPAPTPEDAPDAA